MSQQAPSFDEIRAILKEISLGQKENREQMQKSKQENDRLLRESKRENDRRKQETDRKIQENDRLLQEGQQRLEQMIKENKEDLKKMIQANDLHIKQIDSRWGNQWGILVEALTEGSLVQIFKEKGIDVQRTLPNHRGHYQNKEREFDAIAIDGQELVVVEAKSHFIMKNVDYFLKTLENFKRYCPEFSQWVIYGGIAYLRKNEEVLSYAEQKGLFVLHVHGKNAIMLNKQEFKPKIFCQN